MVFNRTCKAPAASLRLRLRSRLRPALFMFVLAIVVSSLSMAAGSRPSSEEGVGRIDADYEHTADAVGGASNAASEAAAAALKPPPVEPVGTAGSAVEAWRKTIDALTGPLNAAKGKDAKGNHIEAKDKWGGNDAFKREAIEWNEKFKTSQMKVKALKEEVGKLSDHTKDAVKQMKNNSFAVVNLPAENGGPLGDLKKHKDAYQEWTQGEEGKNAVKAAESADGQQAPIVNEPKTPTGPQAVAGPPPLTGSGGGGGASAAGGAAATGQAQKPALTEAQLDHQRYMDTPD